MSSLAACHNCSRPYGDAGWIEAVVPDEVWALISPTGNEGGILCIGCIGDAVAKAGLPPVPVLLTAGPLRSTI